MLVIKNKNKIIGDTFVDGRFLCSNFEETNTLLSFWFKDLEEAGGIWVQIRREPQWDDSNKRFYYKVVYPNQPAEHNITADWFADIDNARHTFEHALKRQ